MAFAPIAKNRRMVSEMEARKKIVALCLAATVLFVTLCSAFFIAAEADHDCIGENCPICYQVNVCQNILKNTLPAACAALSAAFAYALCRNVSAYTIYLQRHTLISLKVELLD